MRTPCDKRSCLAKPSATSWTSAAASAPSPGGSKTGSTPVRAPTASQVVPTPSKQRVVPLLSNSRSAPQTGSRCCAPSTITLLSSTPSSESLSIAATALAAASAGGRSPATWARSGAEVRRLTAAKMGSSAFCGSRARPATQPARTSCVSVWAPFVSSRTIRLIRASTCSSRSLSSARAMASSVRGPHPVLMTMETPVKRDSLTSADGFLPSWGSVTSMMVAAFAPAARR
mmetsp:Transcript_20553/g.47418  ORF Transcript_20553/g.47418 Transcript_20553/m.47418 type:complete len:230 (+) Transcript_20553:508-1197(+)